MAKPTFEQLQEALGVAVAILMLTEPGDSREVSSETVALAALASGDASDNALAVIAKAKAELQEA